MKTILKPSLALGIALVISGAIFSACGKKEEKINEVYFTDSCKIYDINDKLTDTLQSEQILKEAFGAYRIVSADTILCMTTRDNNAIFALYSTNGDSLASVGVMGQGLHDFTIGWTKGMRFDNGDDVGIWVIDVNAARLKGFNISKSLREGKSVVDTSYIMDPMVMNAVYTDGKIIESVPVGDNYEFRIISAADLTVLYKEPLFKIKMNPMFTSYYCDMVLSPNGRYVVMTMRALNAVNIIDLNDYSRLTASVGNVPHKDEVQTDKSYENSPVLSDKYIMTLSDNGSVSSEKRPSSLHIFDYQGNLIANVPLDRYLYSITYVAKDNSIYAIDDKEGLFRYPLDSIGLTND